MYAQSPPSEASLSYQWPFKSLRSSVSTASKSDFLKERRCYQVLPAPRLYWQQQKFTGSIEDASGLPVLNIRPTVSKALAA